MVKRLILIEVYSILQINLRRSDKYVALSNLSTCYTWKNKKIHIRTMIKYQLQHGIKNLNCLMDHILNQMFKIILNIY